MARFFHSLSFLFLFPIFAGCAIGVPQNRQEFVTMYKDARVFGKAEHFTISGFRRRQGVLPKLSQRTGCRPTKLLVARGGRLDDFPDES